METYPAVATAMPMDLPVETSSLTLDTIINAQREELQMLKEKSLREQESSLESIRCKNLELNTQRVKIKQYEFALQEALVFLAKPLNNYEDWINSESSQELQFEFSSVIPNATGKTYKVSQKADEDGNIAHRRNHSTTTAELGGKGGGKHLPQQSAPGPAKSVFEKAKSTTSAVPPPTPDDDEDLSKLEITCLESMRLCFNFLRSCQKQNLAIDNGTYNIPTETTQSTENESLALANNPVSPGSATGSAKGSSSSLSKRLVSLSNPNVSAIPVPVAKVYVEDTAGDLSLTELDDFKAAVGGTKNSCEKCHKSLLLLDTFKDKLKIVEARNVEVEARLRKEIAARKVCQESKAMIDEEIVDITAELFARANQMVVDESRKMDLLATKNRELTKKVSDAESRLSEKELELSNAIRALYDFQSVSQTSTSSKSYNNDPANPKEVEKNTTTTIGNAESKVALSTVAVPPTQFIHSIFSGFDQFKSSIAADGFIFQEFQDLVKVMVVSSNLPSLQAYQAIHATIFMKRCMIESVEPCLLYTYAPNNSFKSLGTAHPLSFKKKLLDCVIKGHALVELQQGERLPKSKCLQCTITRNCEYKITLGGDSPTSAKAESLCRFCRDRVLAVQDFFSFITFLSGGKHGLTILSTFRQVLWTRRRMALALIGSCSMFETEVTAITGPGAGGNWEKASQPLY